MNSAEPATADRGAREDEALPAGCDDDERRVRDPDVGDRPQVCDLGISTALDPCVYDPPAIVDADVVGQYLRERIPVAGCEVRRVALGRLACRVFQPPRLAVCLVLKPGMRGVEFGDRGIHVFEVEPDLQGDSTLFVDAQLREAARPPATPGTSRLLVPSADCGCEPSRSPRAGDNHATMPAPRPTSSEAVVTNACPLARVERSMRGKPTILRRLSMLETAGASTCSVPATAPSRCRQLVCTARHRPRARVIRLDARRFGRSRSARDGALPEAARRALSASAAAPFRSAYRSTARSAAARAPAASPAAPKTVASVRQESP